MKSNKSFIVAIFTLIILIFTVSYSQELKLKQDVQKRTLEERVADLELKVKILADHVKILEKKIDHPQTKMIPVK